MGSGGKKCLGERGDLAARQIMATDAPKYCPPWMSEEKSLSGYCARAAAGLPITMRKPIDAIHNLVIMSPARRRQKTYLSGYHDTARLTEAHEPKDRFHPI